MPGAYSHQLPCSDSAGDPKRLLHHLGLGFWSFLAEPTAGLLQASRRGPQTAALVANIIEAQCACGLFVVMHVLMAAAGQAPL